MKTYLKNFLVNFGALIMLLSVLLIILVFYEYFFVSPDCSTINIIPGSTITPGINSLLPCGWRPPFKDFLSSHVVLLAPLVISFGIYKLGKKINE